MDQHHDHDNEEWKQDMYDEANENQLLKVMNPPALTARIRATDLITHAAKAMDEHDYLLAASLLLRAHQAIEECDHHLDADSRRAIAIAKADKIAHDIDTLPF